MITTPAAWLRLVGGLALVFALFQWSATALHSDRGEAGLIVAALVVAATLSAEVVLFRRRLRDAARMLGLGVPDRRGLIAAATVSALLLLVVPVLAYYSRTAASLTSGWLGSIPGLFAQAGIAEEILFRGWLFGHLRHGRSFRNAAVVSMETLLKVVSQPIRGMSRHAVATTAGRGKDRDSLMSFPNASESGVPKQSTSAHRTSSICTS